MAQSVGVAERERAWLAEAGQVVGRLHLAVSRVEDLAARLEVVLGRLEALAPSREATSQALREALESGSEAPASAE